MELNAEQIKKALEYCSPSGKHCTECVYFYRAVDDICAPYLMADALTLITSQEQMIEAYRQELAEVRVALAEANKERQELTEELISVRNRADETIDALHSEVKELTEENERLQKALNTDISIVRVVSRGSGKTAHLREVGRIKADAIRANTVREMQTAIKKYYSQPKYLPTPRHPIRHTAIDLLFAVIDQIAKEMLEGENG